MSNAGNRLIGAAKEALAIARGDATPARQFIPADIDVRAIRAATKLSQEDFAATFGFSVTQIRDWEQHRSRPLAGLRAYLMLIQSNPQALAAMLKDLQAAEIAQNGRAA